MPGLGQYSSYPRQITSHSFTGEGTFPAAVAEQNGPRRRKAFAPDASALTTPTLVASPKGARAEVYLVSQLTDAKGISWAVDDNGRLFQLAADASNWSLYDTKERRFQSLSLASGGTIMAVEANGTTFVPDDAEDAGIPAGPITAALTKDVIKSQTVFRRAWAWFWKPQTSALPETDFDSDVDALGPKVDGRRKVKTEIFGVKYSGQIAAADLRPVTFRSVAWKALQLLDPLNLAYMINRGLDFFEAAVLKIPSRLYEVGQWARLHFGNGVFARVRGDHFYETKSARRDYSQAVDHLLRRSDSLDQVDRHRFTLLDHLSENGILNDLVDSLARLENQLGENSNSRKGSKVVGSTRGRAREANLIELYARIAERLIGLSHPVTVKLRRLDEGKVSLSQRSGQKYSALLAQIANDLSIALQTLEKMESGRPVRIDKIINDRNTSFIHKTRLTGIPDLTSAGNVFRAVSYFDAVLKRRFHKIRRQFSELNIRTAEDLKNKLRGMRAGDSIELHSGWTQGLEVKINGGYTFGRSIGSFFGFTAGLGAGNSYRYSIKFTKNDDGSVSIGIRRDEALVVDVGLDVYSDVTLLSKGAGLEFYPEVDLSVDTAFKNGRRDGIALTISPESLFENTQGTVFDKLFNGKLDPVELLRQARDGSVSGTHRDVCAITVKASTEISFLPYKSWGKSDAGKGSFYVFLPGVGADAAAEVFKSESETFYDPRNAGSLKVKKFKGLLYRRTYAAAARIGLTNRYRFGGEVDTNNSGQGPDVGVPLYTKASIGISGPKFDTEERARRRSQNLLPKNRNFNVEWNTDESGKKVITDINWSVSIDRDHRLLKIPVISRMLEEGMDKDQRIALKKDLTHLISFTNKENRDAINANIESLQTYFRGLPVGDKFSDSDKQKSTALIKRLRRYSDFTKGHFGLSSGMAGDVSHQRRFINSLKALANLAPDGGASGHFKDLNRRLKDSRLWEKPGPSRSGKVSVSVRLDPAYLENIDISDPEKAHASIQKRITKLLRDDASIQITGFSASQSRMAGTRFAGFPVLFKSSSEGGRTLVRRLGQLSLTHNRGVPEYLHSQTNGYLFPRTDQAPSDDQALGVNQDRPMGYVPAAEFIQCPDVGATAPPLPGSFVERPEGPLAESIIRGDNHHPPEAVGSLSSGSAGFEHQFPQGSSLTTPSALRDQEYIAEQKGRSFADSHQRGPRGHHDDRVVLQVTGHDSVTLVRCGTRGSRFTAAVRQDLPAVNMSADGETAGIVVARLARVRGSERSSVADEQAGGESLNEPIVDDLDTELGLKSIDSPFPEVGSEEDAMEDFPHGLLEATDGDCEFEARSLHGLQSGVGQPVVNMLDDSEMAQGGHSAAFGPEDAVLEDCSEERLIEVNGDPSKLRKVFDLSAQDRRFCDGAFTSARRSLEDDAKSSQSTGNEEAAAPPPVVDTGADEEGSLVDRTGALESSVKKVEFPELGGAAH